MVEIPDFPSDPDISALTEAKGEGGLLPEDLQPMTAEQRAWFDANRQVEPEPEPDECRALPEGSGRCAYAGPDGKDACGVKCIYRGERRDH